jgi:hypothetical protein
MTARAEHQVQSRRWLPVALGLLSIALVATAQTLPPGADAGAVPQTIEFDRDVRPILSDNCYICHGPSKQMAGLRLDREEVAKHALPDNRLAIVSGDPGHSEMLRRVSLTTASGRMPQGGEPLSSRDVAVIQRWIEQGATWQKHWSFVPPRRPALPIVTDQHWVRNPIDAFVLERLEREGLRPAPAADRATWIRRVTLDLVGLPPTPAEIDAFVADRSMNADGKVVDRLLQSPRYGERMAFPWLEAARYADSNGYQTDGERDMWRWRDWVINAFNRNMPFDRFTVEQLAGDLLPNPTLDQRIATGFNRNHRGNSEGGIIPEEYAVEYVVDRVDTTATVFLGLTAGCARCHDHRYDPLSQKQYYQLFSYFNNLPESGKARRVGNSPPSIKAPTPDQQRRLKQLDDRLASATRAYAALQPGMERAEKDWERSLDRSAAVTWAPARGLVAHYALDGDLSATVAVAPDGKPVALRFQNGEPVFTQGSLGQAASFDGKTAIEGGDIAGFGSHVRYDDQYSLAAWIRPTAKTGAIVTKVQDVTEPNGHGLNLHDGKIEYNNVTKWVDEGIRLRSVREVTLNEWHHVAIAYDGTRYAEGVKLYVDGEEWKWEVLLDDANNLGPARREPLRIGGGGGPENRFQGSIDDVRIYDRALSASEARILATRSSVTDIARLPEKSRTAGQADKIRDYFLEHALPMNINNARKRLIDTQAKRDAFYDSLPTVMVMEEMPRPRETHLLKRGAYDAPGEIVTPTLPEFLASSPGDYPPNRLGLARWLVSPSDPLLARVTVNRFWQMLFGTGIVRTVEDFGSQGEWPSHPELLDWLATEFVSTGWDVKALLKTIVTSASYRQSSRGTADLLQRDPENRLLARGSGVRLTADVVRDQALAMAGVLVNKVGGPSVMPYQPAGIWKELNSSEDYVQSHGEDLYRRSLYTFWKRTVPPPTMANFDASSRESCVVRRSVTNTPLQALDLMNDITYVEAARVMAQRMIEEGGLTPEARIRLAFRLATARPPKPAESHVLVASFNRELHTFKARPDAAIKYVGLGEYPRDERLNVSELAAYTTVASLILNLSETVTKN